MGLDHEVIALDVFQPPDASDHRYTGGNAKLGPERPIVRPGGVLLGIHAVENRADPFRVGHHRVPELCREHVGDRHDDRRVPGGNPVHQPVLPRIGPLAAVVGVDDRHGPRRAAHGARHLVPDAAVGVDHVGGELPELAPEGRGPDHRELAHWGSGMKGGEVLQPLGKAAQEPERQHLVLEAAVVPPTDQVGDQPLQAPRIEVQHHVKDPDPPGLGRG